MAAVEKPDWLQVPQDYCVLARSSCWGFMGRNIRYVKENYTRGYFWCSAFELLPWRIVQDCFKLLVGSQFQSMKSYSHHRWLFAAVSNLSDVRPIQFAEMLYRAGENWSLGVILNHFYIQVVIYENILMAAYSSSYNCNFSKLTKSLSNTFWYWFYHFNF